MNFAGLQVVALVVLGWVVVGWAKMPLDIGRNFTGGEGGMSTYCEDVSN